YPHATNRHAREVAETGSLRAGCGSPDLAALIESPPGSIGSMVQFGKFALGAGFRPRPTAPLLRSPTMSSAVETKTFCTPEGLLAMPDGENYELVGGQLVERNVG